MMALYRPFAQGRFDGISIGAQPIYLKGKIAFWCQNKIYLV